VIAGRGKEITWGGRRHLKMDGGSHRHGRVRHRAQGAIVVLDPVMLMARREEEGAQ